MLTDPGACLPQILHSVEDDDDDLSLLVLLLLLLLLLQSSPSTISPVAETEVDSAGIILQSITLEFVFIQSVR